MSEVKETKQAYVGDDVSFDEFKDLYLRAYEGGASGCTTFRAASIETRGEVMKKKEEKDGKACEWDPITGSTCAD